VRASPAWKIAPVAASALAMVDFGFSQQRAPAGRNDGVATTGARGGVGKQTLTEQLSAGAARAPAADAQPPASGLGAPPWVASWVQTLATADQLRRARQAISAAPAGGELSLGGHAVTLDDAQRAMLQDALRRQAMARVVAVRAPLRPQLAAAADATHRREIQDRMRSAARPWLDELRDPAQPGARFAADPATQNEVLAALTLDGEGNAEAELADQAQHGAAGPQARARQAAHLPHGAWCGAFAFATQHGAGLGDQARTAMQSTGPQQGIDALLDYAQHQQVMWTGSQWQHVRDYHAARGSLRRLTRTPRTPVPITTGSVAAPLGLDIQPGDIVLIDNAKGAFADHITQCRSYDPSTGQLETIAGNEGSGEGRVAASERPRDLDANPAARVVAPGAPKPSRVYAFGRFSIVDYESHTYLPHMPADPTRSPDAMAPAQARRR
jgi:hypothetical protein